MNRSPTTEPVFRIIIREIVGICYSLVVQDGCDPEQLCKAGIGFVAFLKVITLVRDEKNHKIEFFSPSAPLATHLLYPAYWPHICPFLIWVIIYSVTLNYSFTKELLSSSCGIRLKESCILGQYASNFIPEWVLESFSCKVLNN